VPCFNKLHHLPTCEERGKQCCRLRVLQLSATNNCMTYGRYQHLRVTVSMTLSGQRGLLPHIRPWGQEHLWVWIPSSQSLYFVLHTRPALKSWFCNFFHFLHAPTKNSKDPEKSTNSCDPYARKAIARPKGLSPYISSVRPLQNPQKTHPHSCWTNHRPIAYTEVRLSTPEVNHRPGQLADTGHWG